MIVRQLVHQRSNGRLAHGADLVQVADVGATQLTVEERMRNDQLKRCALFGRRVEHVIEQVARIGRETRRRLGERRTNAATLGDVQRRRARLVLTERQSTGNGLKQQHTACPDVGAAGVETRQHRGAAEDFRWQVPEEVDAVSVRENITGREMARVTEIADL